MSEAWTSRQRVETTLAHRQPDRVPVDLTITIHPYQRLRQYLGFQPEEQIRADSFGEIQPDPILLERLGVDITFIKLRKPANWKPQTANSQGIIIDEWGVGRRPVEIIPGVYLQEVVYTPLKAADLGDLDNYPWPDPYDPGRVDGLEEEARRIFEGTELALMGRFGGTILETAGFLRGWEQWLMDMVAQPAFARALLEKIADIQIALDEAGIRVAGKYLSIFKVSGEDLGMQDRPLFSQRTWQLLVRPVLERRWQAARKALDRYAPHVRLMLHSDGAIRPFIPDLIDAGIDLLDPVQVHCQGMEPSGLKRDFGDRMSFHGAVDTQEILPFGSPEDVRQHVRQCLKALGPGGGYILAPVHNVQPDVSPQNLVAMCEAAQEYGQYPLDGE